MKVHHTVVLISHRSPLVLKFTLWNFRGNRVWAEAFQIIAKRWTSQALWNTLIRCSPQVTSFVTPSLDCSVVGNSILYVGGGVTNRGRRRGPHCCVWILFCRLEPPFWNSTTSTLFFLCKKCEFFIVKWKDTNYTKPLKTETKVAYKHSDYKEAVQQEFKLKFHIFLTSN